MQRQTVAVAAVGVLCILALSVAAATLDSSTAAGESGGIGGGGSVLPPQNQTPVDETPGPPVASGRNASAVRNMLRPAFCIPALRDPVVLVGVAGAVGAAVAALAWKNDFTWSFVTFAVVAGGPGIFFLFALWFTLTGCESPTAATEKGGPAVDRDPLPPGGGGTGGEATAPTAPEPSMLLLALVGLALVAAVAAVVRGTGDDVVEREPATEDGALSGLSAVADVAAAAGAAADRIEASGEVDNEVYRAWREMTRHLDTDRPASSTPAEFREAAVAAGMDPEHVDALTGLFEDVRYGGHEATAEREERAVDALRRIEAAYGEEGSR